MRWRAVAAIIGLALIAFAGFIGSTVLYWGQFCDEGDNLVLGKWINHGLIPYRDLFSHHFPFSYWFLAVAFRCFGETMCVARMSVLLFETLAVLIVAVLTHRFLAAGLFYFTWSLMSPYYFGNMAIYQRFAAIGVFVMFTVLLRVFDTGVRMSRTAAVIVGIFGGLALLSYSETAWCVVFSFLMMLSQRSARRAAWISIATAAVCLIGALLVLIATDSLSAFYDQAILFNLDVYSKYTSCQISLLKNIIPAILKLLHLFDPQWFNGSLEISFSKNRGLDAGLLTGWAYRFFLLLLCFALLLRKRYRASVYAYGSAAILTSLHGMHFRALPFLFIAVYAVSVLATDFPKTGSHQAGGKVSVGLSRIASVLAILMALTWQFRFSSATYSDANRLTYEATFGHMARQAEKIHDLTQGDDSIKVAFYPGNIDLYFWVQNRPLCRYIYLWPWVAEIGMDEVIDALKHEKALLILTTRGDVWNRPHREFLSQLIHYTQTSCHALGNETYLSHSVQIRQILQPLKPKLLPRLIERHSGDLPRFASN